jgi:HK97 family phage major capsid protein
MRSLADQEIRAGELMVQITNLQSRSDAEDRDLTNEEGAELDARIAEYDTVVSDIDRRRRIENAQRYLAAPAPQSNQPAPRQQSQQPAPRQRPNGGAPVHRVTVENRAAGTHGFNSLGEFALAVRNASLAGRPTDPRLVNASPLDNVMTEGVGPDGGYAVPPDFRATIIQLVNAEDSLLSRTDLIETSSNAVTLPVDATTPWQQSGGIQAYWEGEAQQKIGSKTPLDQVTVKLNKIYVLIALSDELMEDAPALTTLLQRKAPEKIDYEVSYAILNGTGTGQPQGIYNSPAAIVVPRDAAQPVKTVTASNVLAMWARALTQSRNRMVWVTNQDIESSFATMFIPILNASGQVVNGQVTYLPPGGLSGNPYSTLMGRPIVVTEAAPDAGQQGDLALIDFKSYLTAEKVGGGVKQDLSIHLLFDYDVSCLRFVLRIGGIPYFKAPVPNRAGTTTRSPFVLLGADGAPLSEEHARLPHHAAPHDAVKHPMVEAAQKSNEQAERALAAKRATAKE